MLQIQCLVDYMLRLLSIRSLYTISCYASTLHSFKIKGKRHTYNFRIRQRSRNQMVLKIHILIYHKFTENSKTRM